MSSGKGVLKWGLAQYNERIFARVRPASSPQAYRNSPMNEISNSLVVADIAHSMHPYTNMRAHEEQGPMVIARGEGIRVFDDKGKEYIEGMAGLWSVAVGFSESRLKDAAMKQMELLPYYHTFAHKAHEPSIRLAEKLAEMTPGDLNHCFFTNSGSEANDTVVKMVWFMNNALGRPNKKKFLARNKGYHGITIASGSLTGDDGCAEDVPARCDYP